MTSARPAKKTASGGSKGKATKKAAAKKAEPAKKTATARARSAQSSADTRPEAARSKVTRNGPSAAAAQLEFKVKYGRREYVVGRVLGSLMLHFRAGTKDVVAAATRALSDWGEALPVTRCTWWRRNDQQDFRAADARSFGSLLQQLSQVKQHHGARFVQHDPAEKDPEEWSNAARSAELDLDLSQRGSDGYSIEASHLRMLLPREEFAKDAGRFRDLMLSTCEYFPIQSGSVGYTLSTGYLRKQDKAVDRALEEVYLAWPTLELEDPLGTVMVQADRLRGVGWLTLLGPDAQKALGGEKRITERLGSGVEVHHTAHALVLQAGPAPVLGDDPASLEPYRAVYAAVRPLIDPILKLLTPEGKAIFQRLA